MRLVEVKDYEHIKFYRSTYYGDIIQEFLDSDVMCAEVTDYKARDSYVCAYGIRNALKRMKVSQVRCYSLNRRVFLEKVGFKDEHKN